MTTMNTNRPTYAVLSDLELAHIKETAPESQAKVTFIKSKFAPDSSTEYPEGTNYIWRVEVLSNLDAGWVIKDYRKPAQGNNGVWTEQVKADSKVILMDGIHAITAGVEFFHVNRLVHSVGLHILATDTSSPESVVGAVYGSSTDSQFGRFAIENQWTEIIARKIGNEYRYLAGSAAGYDRSTKYDYEDMLFLEQANFSVVLDIRNSMTDLSNPESFVSRQIRLLSLERTEAQEQSKVDSQNWIDRSKISQNVRKEIAREVANDVVSKPVVVDNVMKTDAGNFPLNSWVLVYRDADHKNRVARIWTGDGRSNAAKELRDYKKEGRFLVVG